MNIIIRVVLSIFYLFPIKMNKVVLQAYNGRLFSCSPKYLAEGLLETKRYDVYFALSQKSKESLPKRIKRINYRSLMHFYHLMTAGFVIFNSTGFTGFLPYRKKQVIIQTWHGGYSFKVIGNDIFTDEKSVKRRQLSGRILTYFLSGSRMATEQHSSAMSTPREKFLEIGLPRNDILFQNHADIRKAVYREFKLDPDKRIVLYAPTYRDGGGIRSMADYGLEPIDDAAVVEALNNRFGGSFVFMFKSHHDMLPSNIGEHCVNASDHSDIQDLMCAADVIITDYSSCMADFALQKKPGFLFTPDIEEYEAVHPLSMDPNLWPYQIAHSNKELLKNIVEYDEKAGLSKIEDFFDRIGNCDEGHAVDSMIEIMDKHLET